MKLIVLAFGKLKTPGLRETADFYLSRIQPWARVQETELKPIPAHDLNPNNYAVLQRKESEHLHDQIEKHRLKLVLLDPIGKSLSSEGWAQRLERWKEAGGITLAVGSSLGFGQETRAVAQECLSLGPQTLSHELARVVLYEQLYRGLSILERHPYHHSVNFQSRGV